MCQRYRIRQRASRDGPVFDDLSMKPQMLKTDQEISPELEKLLK